MKSLNSPATEQEKNLEKLRTDLELLGLSPQEALIVALLLCNKKSMTIKEISEEVEIPNYLLYNILNLLTQKGFIEQISLKPKSYVSDQILIQQSTELFEQEIYSHCDSYRNALKKGEEEVFKILGMDEDQKRVYNYLETTPGTRKDLVTKLDISYEKIRTITENLFLRKFIQKKMKGKSILYFIVPLNEIIETEIQNLKSKLEEHSNRMDMLVTCLETSEESKEKESKSNQISVIETHSEIHRKVEILSANATEILSSLFIEMTQDFSNWRELIEQELTFALKLIEEGKKIKWLVNRSFIEIFKNLDTKIIHQTIKAQPDFSIKIVQAHQFTNRIIIIEEQNYFEFPKSSDYLNKAISIADRNIAMVKKMEFLNEWSKAIDYRSFLSDNTNSKNDNIILFLGEEAEVTKFKSFKIAFLGNKGVGKTSLIYRHLHGYYDPHITATLGILVNESIIKLPSRVSHQDEDIKLILFDFAGQELFRNYYTNEFDKDAYVIVFSLNEPDSFVELDSWIDEVIANSKDNKKPLIFLLGTKFDLPVKVDKEKIWDIRKKYQIEYFYETSALTGHNINHFFKRIAELLDN